ncbi:hypothetical protein B0H10DRAFT_1944263 [Mycena sp. CBHHK59/15]|nr:hypothetical protein B0H10DRAFT_1944263 [Mycena sp. CBHHK59/15]
MYAGCQFYTVTAAPASEVEEEAFLDVYHNCDIPLDVLSGLLSPSGSSVTLANFSINEDSGLACAGDAENSDAEAEEAAPVALGRGQRKKMAIRAHFGRSTNRCQAHKLEQACSNSNDARECIPNIYILKSLLLTLQLTMWLKIKIEWGWSLDNPVQFKLLG